MSTQLPPGAYDILVTAYSFSAQAQTIIVTAGAHLDLRWKLPLAKDMCDFPQMNWTLLNEGLTITISRFSGSSRKTAFRQVQRSCRKCDFSGACVVDDEKGVYGELY
jgi:hypothetical protein